MKDHKKTKEVELHLINRHNLWGLYWARSGIDDVYCNSMPEDRGRWIWEAFRLERYDGDLLIRTFPFSIYLIEKGNTSKRSLDSSSLSQLILDCVKKENSQDALYWVAHAFVQKILKGNFSELNRNTQEIMLPPYRAIECVDHVKQRRIVPESMTLLKEKPYRC